MMRLVRNYALPLLAVGMLAFAVMQVVKGEQAKPKAEPPVPPARMPYSQGVAGAGIVEPYAEASTTSTIAVGSQLSGVVTVVHVRIGQEVKTGDLLFELDKRQNEADFKVKQAALKVAEVQVQVADANAAQQRDIYRRAQEIYRGKALGEQDLVTAEQTSRQADAQLEQARANVGQATALVEQARTTLELMEVRAPVDGTVLQINV